MTQSIRSIIKEIKKDCRAIFQKYEKKINRAHGWDHVERVRKTTLKIAKLYNKGKTAKEKVSINELEITALLHDIGRYKNEEDNHAECSYKLAVPILEKYKNKKSFNVDNEKILNIVRNHSYPTANKCTDKGIFKIAEFKILTDADKIDSFGPIGILRAPLDKYDTLEKQIKHIKDKASYKQYKLRTIASKKIGKKYKKYLADFLKEYKRQSELKV